MEKKTVSNFILFIDWGTTNFRAYKYNLVSNKLVSKIENNKGILSVKNKSQYIQILKQTLQKLNLSNKTSILMAGMIGSKKGLFEASYVNTPTSLKNLASKILYKRISNLHLMIIPGLVFKKNNYYDVVRGEETLAMGTIEKLKNNESCYLCCPGTHSKWIMINNNKIKSFSTFMTGDLYSAICSNTILKQSLTKNGGQFSKSFYNKGLNFIHKNKEISISNILFKIRTMDLFNQNKSFERSSFLSGLIIGIEMNEILNKNNINKLKIILIASKNLTKLYSIAFNYYKIKYQLANSDECFINGLKKIYDLTN